MACDAEVKELVLFHHDPDHSDLFLDKMLMEAYAHFPRLHCATEGTTATLRHTADARFHSAIEQRQTQRVPVSAPLGVRLQRVGADEVEQTQVGDLSVDGSYFVVDHEWDIGTELEVEIHLPGDGTAQERILRMRGTVARSEKVQGRTGVGVTFRAHLSDG